MTDHESAPTSEGALQRELQELLRDAHANGVDIEGGWDCRNGDGCPDWDVVITEVQKQEAPE